jgi:glycosyltransferase involved in cell wall biosynthesis
LKVGENLGPCDGGIVVSTMHPAEKIDAQFRPTEKLAIIDPSAFTIPYDRHLCNSLGRAGHEVILLTRAARQQDYFRSQSNPLSAPIASTFTTDEHVFSNVFQSRSKSIFGRLQQAAKAVEHVRNMRRLKARLQLFQPSAIHFQWLVIPAVDVHYVKQLRKIAPVFLTVHDAEAFHAPSSRLQMVGWKSALAQFDGLIAHTQQTRECLEAMGIRADRIADIPHGLLCHSQERSHSNPGSLAGDDLCRVLLFGSIKHYKGLDVLVRSLSLVPASIRAQLRLKVAGKPERSEREIRQLAKEVGVDQHIDWQLRFFQDEEVGELFEQCDVVIFPYRRIDASGALMTALPYRKPIIASRIGQFAELLDDRTSAMLVHSDDPQELANALVEVVSKPQLRSRLAAGAEEVLRSIPTWDQIGESTVKFYRQQHARRSTEARTKA